MCACNVLQVLTSLTSKHDIMLALYGSALGNHHSAAYERQHPLQNPTLNKNVPVMAKNVLHLPGNPLSPSAPYYFSTL